MQSRRGCCMPGGEWIGGKDQNVGVDKPTGSLTSVVAIQVLATEGAVVGPALELSAAANPGGHRSAGPTAAVCPSTITTARCTPAEHTPRHLQFEHCRSIGIYGNRRFNGRHFRILPSACNCHPQLYVLVGAMYSTGKTILPAPYSSSSSFICALAMISCKTLPGTMS